MWELRRSFCVEVVPLVALAGWLGDWMRGDHLIAWKREGLSFTPYTGYTARARHVAWANHRV
jgi:hypothetical protein